MQAAGLAPRDAPKQVAALHGRQEPAAPPCWLAATVAHLPLQVQPAAVINEVLHQPAGWLESHAGIVQRRLWDDQDPLQAAAAAGQDCVAQTGLAVEEVGPLLVTSEAPPVLAGLAADLHHRLGLLATAPATEVGGACTGFLTTLWLGQMMLPRLGAVLVIAV